MFDKYKAKKQREINLVELESKEFEVAIKQNEYALKQIEEASNIVVDRDLLDGWTILGKDDLESTPEGHQTMLDQAFKLYHNNLHARNIIRTLTK
ncbi:unnamed protein product, partial [marine sediment metagenome]